MTKNKTKAEYKEEQKSKAILKSKTKADKRMTSAIIVSIMAVLFISSINYYIKCIQYTNVSATITEFNKLDSNELNNKGSIQKCNNLVISYSYNNVSYSHNMQYLSKGSRVVGDVTNVHIDSKSPTKVLNSDDIKFNIISIVILAIALIVVNFNSISTDEIKKYKKHQW